MGSEQLTQHCRKHDVVHELQYEINSERKTWPMGRLRESFGLAAVHTSYNCKNTVVRTVKQIFSHTMAMKVQNLSRASVCSLGNSQTPQKGSSTLFLNVLHEVFVRF